ncbi:S-adenosylmethionine decarboxylase [Terfezia boudieri ATCC MYA-4762]|uniref:adenosylmethionine decarboxylase n=1 Tax=Terfezia boudieri ATCC MYA-4762 TaxID=1051890 RepID=A0A3N4LAI6_9PEZI|nr:S-adenosylmethionine decarboxylase [Terfezia boudieri ATCC MYA-4762]
MVTINTSSDEAPGQTTTLSINHEATADLDSTNAFEGPEKLLEVWFVPSPTMLPESAKPDGLKSVSRNLWEEMLNLVRCKVLSVIQNEHVDAYLLSESSMFVFPHKVVLKTCGTTTLLAGLARLLEIAGVHGGFTQRSGTSMAEPYRVFYSRKAFMFPDRQEHPHKSWPDEVKFMEQMSLRGSAYQVGRMNGEHWYLYLTNANTMLTPPLTPTEDRNNREGAMFSQFNSRMGAGKKSGPNDETLEILMTDLCPVKSKQWYMDTTTTDVKPEDEKEDSSQGHDLGAIVTNSCGLAEIYDKSRFPDSRIDSYIFNPCGYSANAVIPSQDKDTSYYWTVHVTPEPHCSYASFETNVPREQSGRETVDVIESVLETFKPGRFSVTLFEAKPTLADLFRMDHSEEMAVLKRAARMENIKGYRRMDKIVHDLDGYDLVFRSYEKAEA